jgi:hypothetical protein
VAQVRGAIQVGAIQVARWWRELEFSQNLSSAGGSDRPDLKMSSLCFIKMAPCGWGDSRSTECDPSAADERRVGGVKEKAGRLRADETRGGVDA